MVLEIDDVGAGVLHFGVFEDLDAGVLVRLEVGALEFLTVVFGHES